MVAYLKMEKQQLYCKATGDKLIEYDYLGSDIKDGIRIHTVHNNCELTTHEITAKEFHKRFSFEPIETEDEEEDEEYPLELDRILE